MLQAMRASLYTLGKIIFNSPLDLGYEDRPP